MLMVQEFTTLLSSLSPLEMVVAGVTLLSFLIIMWYYLFPFLRCSTFNIKKQKRKSDEPMPISVVVIVRDDMEFLTSGINNILAQEYKGEWQLVIVNFKSEEEETIFQLDMIKKRHPEVYITSLDPTNYSHTTKLAYTIGVKGAAHDHIIFLSPNVLVKSKRWLDMCSQGFMCNDMITGYSAIEVLPGAANRITRCRNIMESLLYMGKANVGRPYKGNELFFGFTRPLFYQCGGFSKLLRLNRGENDLLIQQAAKFASMTTVITPRASVIASDDSLYGAQIDNSIFTNYAFRYYNVSSKLYIFNFSFYSFLFYVAAIVSMIILPLPLLIAAGSLLLVQLLLLFIVSATLSLRTKEKVPYFTLLLYHFYFPLECAVIRVLQRFKPSRGLWI